ncbi:ATP-dependent DNA helicase chl1-like protein [Elsinoe fawcettii]|nr:ATP-dependent DNA helicase chl1-like protein [Elsinoe fawcettii]
MASHIGAAQDEIDFHHPYTPYQIQKDLMLALYNCIDQGKIGIFESPTGTGKSLSLLCGSLTWLRDHKRSSFSGSAATGPTDDEPEWMREHAQKARKQDLMSRRDDLESKLEIIRQKERQIRQRAEQGPPSSKRVKVDHDRSSNDEDTEYMLDDYDSDDGAKTAGGKVSAADELSSETKALLQKLGLGPASDEDDQEENDDTKILICSRTHSQLSQLVGELHRVSFPSAYPADIDQDPPDYPVEQIKQLSLGSRKNLCINKKVSNLSSVSQVNERCLELQESKTPADQKCKFLPNKENEALALDFKHYALSRVRDIEDLAELGTKIGICPYYASRTAISPAEVVMLPYPLLLQKSAREALALSVKDHVVIIDEAHNLMDAILGIYTAEISLAHVETAKDQLMQYLQKFRNRLAGKNRVYVTQTVRLLDSLKAALAHTRSENEVELDSGTLLSGKGVDQINLYKLSQYFRESKLARKVQGYTQHQRQQASDNTGKTVSSTEDQTPVLNIFQNFIMALTNPAKEGRFFYHKGPDTSSTRLKYLLLDPSQHFRDIVTSARSVILCGGTMSPISDYLTQLFPYLPPSRIATLSCSHVIPPSSLYVTTLSTGPANTPFDFSFMNRSSPTLLSSLGQTLLHLLPLIPDGVVLFFPSYSYLDTVMSTWRRTGLLTQIERLKPTFIDSRTANTDSLLRDYATSISASAMHKGALLLSVIGGKLSEGINFSDGLGRCVMVVGMPWPNPNGAEWKARMGYIEERAKESASGGVAAMVDKAGGKAQLGKEIGKGKYIPGQAGRDFAENVCMRAVNQAIGRAIRHKGDWAGIVLIDRRYSRENVRGKLPGWIKGSLAAGEKRLGEVEGEMRDFYARKMSEKT